LAGSSSCPAEEGIKDITKATKVEPFEAPAEKALGTAMPKAVIGGSLIRVGEHFVCLVYLLKSVLGPIITVVVGVIFEG